MAPGNRGKVFPFTLYKYSESGIKATAKIGEVVYLAGQEEVCPSTGKTHFQGFLCTDKRRTCAEVKRFLGEKTAHVTYGRGTPKQNLTYCSKDESRKEGGFRYVSESELPEYGQGKATNRRRDLETVRTCTYVVSMLQGPVEAKTLERVSQDQLGSVADSSISIYPHPKIEEMFPPALLVTRERFNSPHGSVRVPKGYSLKCENLTEHTDYCRDHCDFEGHHSYCAYNSCPLGHQINKFFL